MNVATKSICGMVWLEIFTYSVFYPSGNYLPLCLLVEGRGGNQCCQKWAPCNLILKNGNLFFFSFKFPPAKESGPLFEQWSSPETPCTVRKSSSYERRFKRDLYQVTQIEDWRNAQLIVFEELASDPFYALHPSQTKCPLFNCAGILEQSMKARMARNREQ